MLDMHLMVLTAVSEATATLATTPTTAADGDLAPVWQSPL